MIVHQQSIKGYTLIELLLVLALSLKHLLKGTNSYAVEIFNPLLPDSRRKMRGRKKIESRNTSNKIYCVHIRHFVHKTCNSEVSRCSNNRGIEMYKISAAHAKMFFCQLHLLVFVCLFVCFFFLAVLVAVDV